MDWPHAPVHRFSEAGVYFITGSTLNKEHRFQQPASLDELQANLFALARKHDCSLQAWSLFSNHYHLVTACEDGAKLHDMLSRLHTESALSINRRDTVHGTKVWFQFWDVQLTYEGSWLGRLKYTHENAVHHGLVRNAEQYRWCSASWFAASAKPSFVQTVRRTKIDRLRVYDDFAAALLPR